MLVMLMFSPQTTGFGAYNTKKAFQSCEGHRPQASEEKLNTTKRPLIFTSSETKYSNS
jgi:hypothetical protein